MKLLVLASASPRRKELLASVGIEVEVMPSDVPEEPLHGETPEEHVLRLARDKATEIAGRLGDGDERWVVAADTLVISGGKLLGKPVDEDDARSMLGRLSGCEHSVMTGYSIFNTRRGEVLSRAVETKVRFKGLSEEEIEGYVASGEPVDKAGAYAIQGLGGFMVESIDGSYSNVVGLPICQLVQDLEKEGALRLF